MVTLGDTPQPGPSCVNPLQPSLTLIHIHAPQPAPSFCTLFYSTFTRCPLLSHSFLPAGHTWRYSSACSFMSAGISSSENLAPSSSPAWGPCDGFQHKVHAASGPCTGPHHGAHEFSMGPMLQHWSFGNNWLNHMGYKCKMLLWLPPCPVAFECGSYLTPNWTHAQFPHIATYTHPYNCASPLPN